MIFHYLFCGRRNCNKHPEISTFLKESIIFENIVWEPSKQLKIGIQQKNLAKIFSLKESSYPKLFSFIYYYIRIINQNYNNYKQKKLQMQQPTSTQFSDLEDTKKQTVPPAQIDQTHLGDKINKNFLQRTRWTILMLLGFVVVIAAGQIGCCLLILFMNFFIFRQLNSIKRNQQKQANIPMTKYLNWYFYFLANYFCFGHILLSSYPLLVLVHPILKFLYLNHSFISYFGYIIGFIAFVLSLKQGYLKYQFKLFAWILLTTIMVVFQSWLLIMNTLRGMIWFVLPVLLIVCNDIFAYLVGYFFGSHQLIALSPKKTWEGYLGGAFFTFLFSYLLASAFVTIPGFGCPMTDLQFSLFKIPQCDSSYLLDQAFSFESIPISFMAVHLHVFVLSLFASTIGPFGGFFASGLKRSIKIKDFSNLIPGHGGVSDRMDCQMIMGGFTYFYLITFLHESNFNPLIWLQHLTLNQQALIYQELSKRFIQS